MGQRPNLRVVGARGRNAGVPPAGSAASSLPNGELARVSRYQRHLRVLSGRQRDAAGPAGEDASAPLRQDNSPLRWPHELLEQALQRRVQIVVNAGMYWRRLDDRAARRDEPVEAGSLRESADRARVGRAGADFRDGVEIAVDHRRVDAWSERAQALVIAADAGVEEGGSGGEEDHARVEEL